MILKDNKLSGAVLFWECGPSERAALITLFNDLGLPQCVPDEMTPASALRQAMAEVAPPSNKAVAYDIQPLAKTLGTGFELVRVERGADRNGYFHEYAVKLIDECPRCYGATWAVEDKIAELFRFHRGQCSAQAVGRSLSDAVAAFSGVTLRQAGGIYWLPQDSLATWGKLAAGVECAGTSELYRLNTPIDDDAIHAVHAALAREVQTMATTLDEELAENRLGPSALFNREQHALAVLKKVRAYEDLLSVSLDDVRNAAGKALIAASSAIASQEHVQGGTFAAVFG